LLASPIKLGALSYLKRKSLQWLYHQISLIHLAYDGLFESNKVTNISHLAVLGYHCTHSTVFQVAR
jgi:hypothetical protein